MKIPLPHFLIVLTICAAVFVRADDAPTLAQVRDKYDKDQVELNKVFKETLAGLDKAKAAALAKKETVWEEFREMRAVGAMGAIGAAKSDSPKLSAEYWQTMISYTEQRTEFLRVFAGKGVSAGLNGDYTDSLDGDLQLEQRPEGLFFTFSVVRGKAAQTGQLTGIAVVKGNTAHFKGEAEDGKKACELNFTFVDGHIVKVVEVAADPEAGTGVHYDGEYYKKADSVIHD